jgi:hypothetical protein
MERNLSTVSVGTSESDAAKATRGAMNPDRRQGALSCARATRPTTIRRIAEVVGGLGARALPVLQGQGRDLIALCDQTFSCLIELMEGMDRQALTPLERLRSCGAPISASRSSIRANTG